MNRPGVRQRGDRFHQCVRTRGRSPIDEEHALSIDLRDNIGFSGEFHNEQIVAQSLRAGEVGHRLLA